MNWPSHGGQPETMKQLFNIDKQRRVLDFSANLNPLGPPEWLREELLLHFNSIAFYPDPGYSKSQACLACHEGLGKEGVLLTNGGAEAIFLLAKYFEGKNAIIVQPTFSEYERACRHYHLQVENVGLLQEKEFSLPLELLLGKLAETDIIFLCRPNNPTGTVIPEKEIRILLDKALMTNTYLVVDEAFIDFLPVASLKPLLTTYPNLVLLRSLTKMYTIPGLRLGYMLGSENVIKAIGNEQMPWSINALADAIVPRLMKDRSFVEETMLWLENETNRLFSMLGRLGFYHTPTQVNFYLLADKLHPDRTEELFSYLFQHGILTRHTHNFKGLDGHYLRIAVRSKEENKYLLAILQKWREET